MLTMILAGIIFLQYGDFNYERVFWLSFGELFLLDTPFAVALIAGANAYKWDTFGEFKKIEEWLSHFDKTAGEATYIFGTDKTFDFCDSVCRRLNQRGYFVELVDGKHCGGRFRVIIRWRKPCPAPSES